MKYLLSAAAASALMAGTAFAGNIQPAPVEPYIAPAAPMAAYQSPSWTGFYAGGQLGYASLDSSGSGVYRDEFDSRFDRTFNRNPSGDGFIGGLTLGYDHDFGNWVAGVGADYDWTDINMHTVVDMGNVAVNFGTKIESIWRLKARAGYKIGDGLLYATGGYAQAGTKDYGNQDGYFVGAGYEHLVTQNFSLGAEVLYHEFNNFKAPDVVDFDLEATTVQVRATFRF